MQTASLCVRHARASLTPSERSAGTSDSATLGHGGAIGASASTPSARERARARTAPRHCALLAAAASRMGTRACPRSTKMASSCASCAHASSTRLAPSEGTSAFATRGRGGAAGARCPPKGAQERGRGRTGPRRSAPPARRASAPGTRRRPCATPMVTSCATRAGVPLCRWVRSAATAASAASFRLPWPVRRCCARTRHCQPRTVARRRSCCLLAPRAHSPLSCTHHCSVRMISPPTFTMPLCRRRRCSRFEPLSSSARRESRGCRRLRLLPRWRCSTRPNTRGEATRPRRPPPTRRRRRGR
mmetsp:Transcript_6259/g.20573  ORF Transcript_6259/g.20573 Transcript_6259/m.20573 type:complete len:302 (-) Transcript_6259:2823-3728(-)